MGPLGSGQVTKLFNDVLFVVNLATAAGALALGRALQVDATGLADVMSHGSGSSFALGRISAAGGTLDRNESHAGAVPQKDVRLVGDLADAAGAPTGVVMAAADDALAVMDRQR
jgi:3-hydroxyisobutyrate dehydrogenase